MSASRRLPRELARVSDLSGGGIYYKQDPHILNRGMALIIGPPRLHLRKLSSLFQI